MTRSTGPSLSRVNHHLIAGLCRLIGIETRITWSTDYAATGERTARLVDICRQAGANRGRIRPRGAGLHRAATVSARRHQALYADYETDTLNIRSCIRRSSTR